MFRVSETRPSMPVNRDKPDQWKSDIAASVDMYNDWFMRFAPGAFRTTREQTTVEVRKGLKIAGHLSRITPRTLKAHPDVLPTLRMSTCPPLAVDRLIGLAGVSPGLVKSMENKQRIPPRMAERSVTEGLDKIGRIIERMADRDIFTWLDGAGEPTDEQLNRAATIVADRLCGAVANPIIRNAREKRQLAAIETWLEDRGYERIAAGRARPSTRCGPARSVFT